MSIGHQMGKEILARLKSNRKELLDFRNYLGERQRFLSVASEQLESALKTLRGIKVQSEQGKGALNDNNIDELKLELYHKVDAYSDSLRPFLAPFCTHLDPIEMKEEPIVLDIQSELRVIMGLRERLPTHSGKALEEVYSNLNQTLESIVMKIGATWNRISHTTEILASLAQSAQKHQQRFEP